MNINIIDKHSKIHLIGIGGVSMSGIAELLMDLGCRVTGSDWNASVMTDRLMRDGAEIFIGPQRAENVTDQDLVVYTAAVKPDNPERVRARELGIPEVERPEMLGLLMKRYNTPICVSGTHGKTTTTGLIAQTLVELGCDPTVTVGGELDSIGGNIRIGGREYFVAESCEYCRSFLSFYPKVAVVLNIEEDHLDYYKDIADIRSAFRDFAGLVPDDGCVIANADSENVRLALQGLDRNIITFGMDNNADYRAENIVHDGSDLYSYDLYRKGGFICRVELGIPGSHNIYNSLAATAVLDRFGLDLIKAVKFFGHYTGTHRRFERKGELNGAVIVDDYAHHPTEINATLTTALEMDCKNIYVVFQPHTYSRTKTLYNDFVRVFAGRGIKLVLADIYAAREKDTGLVSSAELAADIPGALYLPSFEAIEDYLAKSAGPGDLVITMGAGDVYKIGENLLKKQN